MLILALSNLVCAPGGIPAFNRLLVRAATEYVKERAWPLVVVVLADQLDAQLPSSSADPLLRYQPCGGSRAALARAIAGYVLKKAPAGICFGHVNLGPVGLLPALMRRPFGVIAHGTEVWTRLSPIRRWSLQKAQVIACVSDHTARCVQLVQGVQISRCARVINALDPEQFSSVLQTPAEPRREPGPLRVLSVTRLHPQEPKGIDLMLQAVAQLPSIEYVVAGEGDALPSLCQLAGQLGISDRVSFLGRISDEERAAQLRRCDVFALPSSGEGFGIVYLEAMAYGKPCIAAQVGGAPEVVLHRETGLVLPPAVQPLREAMSLLATDPALRHKLGQAGQERVRSCFCYPRFREHAFRFFDRLCATSA